MKCVNCGYEPTKGRPKLLNDKQVARLRKQGKSLAEIATLLRVTRSAIQASIKRGEK